jgi:16S rRNA (cytidine1402-2'-O)-methyltransferase
MIPLPIVEGALQTLSPEIAQQTGIITHYFAEDLRTARRFIKSLHPTMVIESLQFSEIDKHTGCDINLFRKWVKEGRTIGIMSDAGCPGIADPGTELTAMAHNMGARVVPLTGPSSILLALMASGLNGQSFAFNGYIPVKEPKRSQRIKELEAISAKEKQTQIFIETPYRNNIMLGEILKNCKTYTKLCIAQNVTAPGEYIKTKSIADWKTEVPHLEKLPVVFLILGF